jgi:dTMP kinase
VAGAEAIRHLLLDGGIGRWAPPTEALLHNAARSEHVRRLIRPALAGGALVLSDRFTDSTLAYQGYGLGLPLDSLAAIADFATDGLRPDLTLLLDLPAQAGLQRARARLGPGGAARAPEISDEQATAAASDTAQPDRYERRQLAFHQRLREGFQALAAAAPDRFRCLDATRPPKTVALQAVAHILTFAQGRAAEP